MTTAPAVRVPARKKSGPASKAPTLTVERRLAADGDVLVLGCDEVGRGALAGPVAVGLSVLAGFRRPPVRLRDSKLIAPAVREALVPEIESWLAASAVGFVEAEEIDEIGIMASLGLAAARAYDALEEVLAAAQGREIVILLDGNHDWLARALDGRARVVVRPKADRDCASVAAASVVAKVSRDAHMVGLHDAAPHFLWNENKGYASKAHRRAIVEHGPSEWHRQTWLSRVLAEEEWLALPRSGGWRTTGAPASIPLSLDLGFEEPAE